MLITSPMICPKISKILYGGDYNPEQWAESVWLEDAKLMRETGVNFVSVGIFSWASLQPNEETFNFGWLDRVMDILAAHGIFVCLATATASPPPWLSTRYPEVLPVDVNGLSYYPGSRQHYSPSSSIYRKYAANLVVRLAERYGKHPALCSWHINNEYGCHLQECHNPESTAAFRAWLKGRYKTLEGLNEAWGTAFWSQAYAEWEEILTPRRAPYHCNPSQQLDFRRFTNEAFLGLCVMERDILREISPGIPVVTNFMGFFKWLDYRQWARELDYTAWDSYPDPSPSAPPGERVAAAGHDLTRSFKKDRSFVLMEQASSAVNWRPVNAPKAPGVMRLWSLQTIARGGDGVMFFQWRASRAGAEKYHSGMIQHIPPERSRVYSEIKALGAELDKLAPVAGSLIHARVAIAIDWHAWWAVELDSRPGRIDYSATLQEFHRYFYERNIAVDFVHPGEDLRAYALIVAPSLYLLRGDDAANLERFVSGGGSLLVSYFSGIVDEHDHVVLGGYPAHLRKILGLWVEEWYPLTETQSTKVCFGDSGKIVEARHWCDLLHLEGAKAWATYLDDFFAGRPAVTANRHGKGAAYYLGTKLDGPNLAEVLDRVCDESRVAPILAVPVGVEVTLRKKPGQQFLFILNHRITTTELSLGKYCGTNILSGQRLGGSLELGPRDVAVIALE